MLRLDAVARGTILVDLVAQRLEAPDHGGAAVRGVVAVNDVSARDLQKSDVQWWRAKGSDTFGPCGPFIATGIDYANLDQLQAILAKLIR